MACYGNNEIDATSANPYFTSQFKNLKIKFVRNLVCSIDRNGAIKSLMSIGAINEAP